LENVANATDRTRVLTPTTFQTTNTRGIIQENGSQGESVGVAISATALVIVPQPYYQYYFEEFPLAFTTV
jgi:hypothetical protein